MRPDLLSEEQWMTIALAMKARIEFCKQCEGMCESLLLKAKWGGRRIVAEEVYTKAIINIASVTP